MRRGHNVLGFHLLETSKVLSALASSEEVRELAKRIRTGKAKELRADGLCGSSVALLLASIMNGRGNNPNMLVVMNDMDDAGYLYHDLTQMMGDERVLFFPSSYKRAIKYNQKDAGNEILRMQTLSLTLPHNGEGSHAESFPITNTPDGSPHHGGDVRQDREGLLIVTYPDALAERVVSKKELDENTLTVKVGDEFDISKLEKRIFELGFEHTDYVYEPGQFAIRGSIVDVYSFSSDMPYRIDFFGDEVDSIRTFDVQSQLSQGKVEMMTIVPDIKKDNAEYISFLEFLPNDTLIVTQDFPFVCDKIAQIHDEGFSSQAKTLSPTLPGDGEGDLADWESLVVNEETFLKQVVQFRHLEVKQGTSTDEKSVHFNTSPQPLFHKNFELVNQEFHRLMDEGYKICIFADSEKQIARLQSILEELGINTHSSAEHSIPHSSFLIPNSVIIPVNKADKFSFCLRQPVISRIRQAAVFLIQNRDPGILRGIFLQNLPGMIRAAVIDRKNLKIPVSLGKHTLHACADIFLDVIDRYDYRDQSLFFHIRIIVYQNKTISRGRFTSGIYYSAHSAVDRSTGIPEPAQHGIDPYDRSGISGFHGSLE